MALYGAVPMLWGNQYGEDKKKLKATSAALWVNPSETFLKLTPPPAEGWFGSSSDKPGFQSWWVSESGVIDLYLFPGPTPRHVSFQFHQITGFAPMAPLFSLAKHQCRWNYVSEQDLLEVHGKYAMGGTPGTGWQLFRIGPVPPEVSVMS